MTHPVSPDPSSSQRPGTIATTLLLLAGLALWIWADRGDYGSPRVVWLLAAGAAAIAVPAIRRTFAGAKFSQALSIEAAPPFLASVLVGIGATVYLSASAIWQGRDLGPHIHDELMYLLQASQLASGHLWSRLPPGIEDFFDSPYLIVRPVYATMSWPGAALMYVPGVALRLPPWWTSVALGGALVGAFFHLCRELFHNNTVAGIGTVLLIVNRPFHTISVTVNAHVPVLVLGLIAIIAMIRWVRTPHTLLAVVAGAAAGWAVICRPIDAICLILPVIIVAILTMHKAIASPKVAPALALAVLGASPFLLLQLVFDRGVTGDWFDSPFSYYDRRDSPQVSYGFPKYNPSVRPASAVAQKQDMYDQFAMPAIQSHQPGRWIHDWFSNRLPAAFRGGQPAPLLLILAPLGFIAMFRQRYPWGIAVAACVPMFCLLYTPYTIFLPTYAVLCMPAVTLCVLVGMTVLAERFRSTTLRAAIIVATLSIGVANLPEANGGSDDPSHPAGVMSARMLQQFIPPPQRALVLFRYHTGNPVHDEPVYNWSVAKPDDARIVLAHDLGPRDIDLFHHYALTQPDRKVYLLDRADYSLHYLGTAAELGQAHQ